MGLRNLLGIPIPVWVDIKGIIGKVRVRAQMVPDPPFVKFVTVSLMGEPKVDIAATPLNKRLFNVMNLPLISLFVKNSINASAAQYVAPKSLTIDAGKLLIGDTVKKTPNTLGIMWITLHRAIDISAQDLNGSSDPYVVLSFSKFGKPIYSTRVIQRDLNPYWEESTAVLVTMETLKAREKLSLQLWDSDRFSPDDIVGLVEFDLQKLVLEKHGHMERRSDELFGFGGKKLPGRLNWDVGYFSLRPLNKELRTEGVDPLVEANLAKDAKFKGKAGRFDSESEKNVMFIPPDPNYPSGILSIQIHQASRLELKANRGTYSNRHNLQSHSAEYEGEDEGSTNPSSYCNIIINDTLVYRTRTKPYSSMPYFNAGTERFIRNWENTSIMVTVRDSRTRENNALLGIVHITLHEVLKNASQVTKFYPLEGGIGYGSLRVSILFRNIDIKLPRQLLGWDVGVLSITSGIFAEGVGPEFAGYKIKISTMAASVNISARHASPMSETKGVKWIDKSMPIRIVVRKKFSTPLIIRFRSKLSVKNAAIAVFWLRDIPSDEPVDILFSIYRATSNIEQVLQNFHEINDLDKMKGMEKLGTLKMTVFMRSGIGNTRDALSESDSNAREVREAWEALILSRTRKENCDDFNSDEMNAAAIDGNKFCSDAETESISSESSKLNKKDVNNNNSREEFAVGGVKNGWVPTHSRDHSSNLLSSTVSATSSALFSSPVKSEIETNPSSFSAGSMNTIVSKDDEKLEKKELHMRNRGSHQFKIVRTGVWAHDGLKSGFNKLIGLGSKPGRTPDIESEI